MFLKIKKIPRVHWSSDKPYNFTPKFSTFFFLCFGLMLFGLGEGLLIVSFTGASPWSVLAQGISLNVNLSIGTITFLISVAVLILWIPLGQKPGIGTIFNAIIIALMIDLCIKFVPTPSSYLYQLTLAIISVTGVGKELSDGPRSPLTNRFQKLIYWSSWVPPKPYRSAKTSFRFSTALGSSVCKLPKELRVLSTGSPGIILGIMKVTVIPMKIVIPHWLIRGIK